jgi:hypothetical protein
MRLGRRLTVVWLGRRMMMVMMVVIIIPVILNQGIEHELTGGKEQRTRCGERYC